MVRRKQLIVCPTCGEVNSPDNVSCKSCLADLTGKQGSQTGQSQLAQLHRLVTRLDVTNRRLNLLIASIWLIFALFVIWTVTAGIMQVGGPTALFRWPF